MIVSLINRYFNLIVEILQIVINIKLLIIILEEA